MTENNKSQNVRVHHIIASSLGIAITGVPLLMRELYPNNHWVNLMFNGSNFLLYLIIVLLPLYFFLNFIGEKLIHNEWYKNSFFMKEIGKSNTDKKL